MDTVLEDLDRVSYGLKIQVVSLALTVIGIFALMWCNVLYLPELFAGNGALPEGPQYALTFLSLMSAAVGIVGKVYCLRAPEGARAGGLIFASLLLSVGSVLIQIGSQIQGLAEGLRSMAPVSVMFAILGFLMFVAFLKRISEFINAPATAASARWIQAATFVAMILVMFGATLVLQAGGASAGGSAMLLSGVLAMIIIFVRYALLIVRLRRAIDHQIALLYESREGG